MIEHKLPEGMTLPESKACMTEHKFPQDYTEDEWVNHVKHDPTMRNFDEYNLREDHRLRKAGVGGLLEEAGRLIKDLVTSDGQLTVEKEDFDAMVNQRLGSVAAALDGTMPTTRWVVLDYQVGGLNENGLIEHTRPHGNICQRYWDEVNG